MCIMSVALNDLELYSFASLLVFFLFLIGSASEL